MLACLLLAGLSGCGSDGESTAPPEHPAKELARWYKGVEDAVTKMEEKQRGFTQFKIVGQSPPKSTLVKLSPGGAKAGEAAEGAAEQLDRATGLNHEEAAGLYCYFFAFYVDLESAPYEEDFELTINTLVKAKPFPSPGVSESADALRKAMLAAERAGGRGPEVAATVFC